MKKILVTIILLCLALPVHAQSLITQQVTTATPSLAGTVKPDGTTISVNGTGVVSETFPLVGIGAGLTNTSNVLSVTNPVGSGTASQTLIYNSGWVATSNEQDNGTNIGMGGASPTTGQRLTINENSASDAATLGSELSNVTWTVPTGWSGSWAGGFTCVTGTTSPITATISGMASGQVYQLVFTTSGVTSGNVTAGCGGWTDPYGARPYNSTFTECVVATGTGVLQFTPSSTFVGTVSGISLEQYTAATPGIALNLSTGASTSSLQVRIGGTHNLAEGCYAGQYLLGNNTTLFGDSAGTYLTSANATSDFGFYAGFSDTIGSSNTNLGYAAGASNIVGSNNVNVGYLSGDAGIGSTNTNVGYNAGYTNTGSQNTNTGNDADYAGTTGNDNTTNGSYAGQYLTTGSNNVLCGMYAGAGANSSGNSVTTASLDSMLGYETGLAGSTQYNYLTVLGANGVGGEANACIIGGNTSTTYERLGVYETAPVAMVDATAVTSSTVILAAREASGQTGAAFAAYNSSNTVFHQIDAYGHTITGNATTTTTVAAGAEVTGTPTLSGNDSAMTLTGTGISVGAAGTLFVVTYGSAFGATPRVVFSADTAASALCQAYLSASSTTGFTISAGTSAGTSASLKFDVIIEQ